MSLSSADPHRAFHNISGAEGQPFFTTIAGRSVSLAGFGAVIAWLRDDPTGWNPVNLWRVKSIVRHALTIAFLCLSLVPIHREMDASPGSVAEAEPGD